jgi:hypothetical protein
MYLYQSGRSSTQTQSSLIAGSDNATWNFVRFLASNANQKSGPVLQEIHSLPHQSLITPNTQIHLLTTWTFTVSTFGFVVVQFSNSSTGYGVLTITTLNATSSNSGSSHTQFYLAYLTFRSPNGTGYYPVVPSSGYPTLPSSDVSVTLVAGQNSSNSITPLAGSTPFSMTVNITYYQL